MLRLRSSKFFIVVIIMLVLTTSAYAFAATNTASANHPISSYAVSNIVYTFDTSNPSNLATVAFDLDNPAATVKVSLTPGGNLQNCSSATPFTHWSCTLTGTTVTNASSLRVVATQ
jgi:hypothetical protein